MLKFLLDVCRMNWYLELLSKRIAPIQILFSRHLEQMTERRDRSLCVVMRLATGAIILLLFHALGDEWIILPGKDGESLSCPDKKLVFLELAMKKNA